MSTAQQITEARTTAEQDPTGTPKENGHEWGAKATYHVYYFYGEHVAGNMGGTYSLVGACREARSLAASLGVDEAADFGVLEVTADTEHVLENVHVTDFITTYSHTDFKEQH